MEIDLNDLAINLNGAEYEPESFPGLIFRIKSPKSATLIFRSGKLVCTGAKTLEQVEKAIATTVACMKEAGVAIKNKPTYQVQNIVASADLGQEINLNAIAVSLGLDKVEYEPEQFPGLVYRVSSPKVVLLLFGSGKMVCTGAKTEADAELAVKNVRIELSSLKLL
ncbi:MAG: TATA-box-binding protein [Methanomassiliicoccales archaeon]|nr:TATA-box-binding protein [Methanomassiliicoccales archaeon]